MPKTTVGALNAKFMADTRDFTDGLESIEVSQKDLNKITRDATTATDKYDDEVLKLQAALKQGKITQEQYNKALAKTEDRLATATTKSRSFAQSWTELSSKIGLVAGAFRTAHSALSTFMESAKDTVALDNLRKSLQDVSKEDFAAFRIAALDIGEDGKAVADMFRDIDDAIDDILKSTKTGDADSTEMLDRLGISPKQLADAGTGVERVTMLFDALQKQPAASRVSIAKQLGGPEMLMFMQQIEDMGGFQVALNRAREGGLILTDKQLAANRKLVQSWTDLNLQLTNFISNLDAETIGSLTELLKTLTETLKEFKPAMKDAAGLAAGKGIPAQRAQDIAVGAFNPMKANNLQALTFGPAFPAVRFIQWMTKSSQEDNKQTEALVELSKKTGKGTRKVDSL